MPSRLVYYYDQEVRTKPLQGILRGLTWNRNGNDLLVVGNQGRVLKIQDDQLVSFDSGTKHNLRAVSVSPSDGRALIVGNAGTALLLDEDEHFTTLRVPTFENLRSVSWDPSGALAVVAGNNGTLYKYSAEGFEAVDAGRANLRDISWRPKSSTALICSNCFAEEFIPSPNLFSYDVDSSVVKPVNEGRADLIGVDWKPTGDSALVVGYDVVWHNGLIGRFDGRALSPIQFDNKRVYPVAVAWKRSADLAAIVTGTVEAGIGEGALFLWDEVSLNPVYSSKEFFFSDAAWNEDGTMLAAIASSGARTFNS